MKTKSELDGNVESPAEMTGPRSILDINGLPIDPIWAAEFRGFVWGEGTLSASRNQNEAITARFGIGLRSDDEPVLIEFQKRLGGQIHRELYRKGDMSRTVSRWTVRKAEDVLRIAALLVSETGLPFNKARQLDLFTRLATLVARGHGWANLYTPEEKVFRETAFNELRRLKGWTQ